MLAFALKFFFHLALSCFLFILKHARPWFHSSQGTSKPQWIAVRKKHSLHEGRGMCYDYRCEIRAGGLSFLRALWFDVLHGFIDGQDVVERVGMPIVIAEIIT